MITRHSLIPAAYLVLKQDNKILLLRRFNTPYCNGFYSMVAGHVDQGESFIECMVREAKEEAGIDINPKDLKLLHVTNRRTQLVDNNERIEMYFTTNKWEGEITNMEPNKCDDLSWFDLDNLPENIVPEVKLGLEYIKRGEIYSEMGWNN